MNNELEKLRCMLVEANIPFEYYYEVWSDEDCIDSLKKIYGEFGRYKRNQIIYGRHGDTNTWKFDAILQAGSYSCNLGLIETYGDLGTYDTGEPRVMTAEKAFEIIQKDWEKTL